LEGEKEPTRIVLKAGGYKYLDAVVDEQVNGMAQRAARLDVPTACQEMVKEPGWLVERFEVDNEITELHNLLFVMAEMQQGDDGRPGDDGVSLWMECNQLRIESFLERYKALQKALRQVDLQLDLQLDQAATICSLIKAILMAGF
jgi:hypothetical protein